MNKKSINRLGAGKYGTENVKNHPFFKDYPWKKLKNKELKPPITPKKEKTNEEFRK